MQSSCSETRNQYKKMRMTRNDQEIQDENNCKRRPQRDGKWPQGREKRRRPQRWKRKTQRDAELQIRTTKKPNKPLRLDATFQQRDTKRGDYHNDACGNFKETTIPQWHKKIYKDANDSKYKTIVETQEEKEDIHRDTLPQRKETLLQENAKKPHKDPQQPKWDTKWLQKQQKCPWKNYYQEMQSDNREGETQEEKQYQYNKTHNSSTEMPSDQTETQSNQKESISELL